jgi:hypothetical protein
MGSGPDGETISTVFACEANPINIVKKIPAIMCTFFLSVPFKIP